MTALVAACLNLSSWICFSKRDLCSTDVSHILFRRGNVMEVTEDDIEVDCLALEDSFPLRIGESLGGSCCSMDFSFSKAKVFLEYGKCLSFSFNSHQLL